MSNLWRIFLLDWYLLDLLPYDTMFWMTLEYMLCFFLWVKQVALALWSIQVPTHLERRFAQIHLILLKTRCFNGCFVASVCSFPSTKQIKTGFLSPPHSTLTAQKKQIKLAPCLTLPKIMFPILWIGELVEANLPGTQPWPALSHPNGSELGTWQPSPQQGSGFARPSENTVVVVVVVVCCWWCYLIPSKKLTRQWVHNLQNCGTGNYSFKWSMWSQRGETSWGSGDV